MAANPISQIINAAALNAGGFSAPFALDYRDAPMAITVDVALVGGTTVAGWTLQWTDDDLNALAPLPTYTVATANWINDPTLVNLTGGSWATVTSPHLYGRLSVTTLSAGGSLLLRVVQQSTLSH